MPVTICKVLNTRVIISFGKISGFNSLLTTHNSRVIPPILPYPNSCIESLQQDVQLLYHHCRQGLQWFCSLLISCHKPVQKDFIFPSPLLKDWNLPVLSRKFPLASYCSFVHCNKHRDYLYIAPIAFPLL